MTSLYKWYQIRYNIFVVQKRTRCENCGLVTATQLHHCIFRRDKRRPELDCGENLMPTCETCHMSGEVDTPEARKTFWAAQIKRGYDMEKWYNNLSMKVKDDIGFYTK